MFDMNGMFEQSKENYNLKDSNEQKFLNPSHVLAWENDHIGSLGGLELDLFSIDHILNLVLQCPTILSIVPRATRMVSAPCFWVVIWRGRDRKSVV